MSMTYVEAVDPRPSMSVGLQTIVARQFNFVETYARQLHTAHPLLVVAKMIGLQAHNNFYDYFTYLQVVTLKLNPPQEL